MPRHRLRRLPDRPAPGRHLHRGRRRATRRPKARGVPVVDDSAPDKPYAEKIELVARHRSGKHERVVRGIDLVTQLWTDGDRHIPRDYRLYDKADDGLTENDLLRAMLTAVRDRGFAPECVTFDSWYNGPENLELVRGFGWRWLTQLEVDRRVNPGRTGLVAVPAAAGTVDWLEGYGQVEVFKVISRDGTLNTGPPGTWRWTS